MKPTKTDLRVVRCAGRVALNEKLKAETLKAEIETGSTSPRPSPQSGEGERFLTAEIETGSTSPRPSPQSGEGEQFLTRRGLAAVLKVSVRTVDEMVAAGEITPVRIRGLVRFCLAEVVRELTEGDGPRPAGNPKSEVRSPRANGGGVQ